MTIAAFLGPDPGVPVVDGRTDRPSSSAPSLDLRDYRFVLLDQGRRELPRTALAIPDFASRRNELVVWSDHEKGRDLFAELQMCHGPGSYANSAGVASDPKNRSTQDLSGFWFRPEFRRREATRLGAFRGTARTRRRC